MNKSDFLDIAFLLSGQDSGQTDKNIDEMPNGRYDVHKL